MIIDRLVPKRKSKSWKEVREEIIQAIEEEKRAKEPFISISSAGTYPPAKSGDIYIGTASEDSYPLNE